MLGLSTAAGLASVLLACRPAAGDAQCWRQRTAEQLQGAEQQLAAAQCGAAANALSRDAAMHAVEAVDAVGVFGCAWHEGLAAM